MTGPARLRGFRAARALGRKQLAEALGVHRSMIQQLEAGTKSPSLALAVRIARLTDGWCEGAITPFEWIAAEECVA
ncbi:MAG: helix-turn-helix transcriptional regulator [Sandaracinus sp.]|nr:helix-turn-helix transcriptional regulator [Sandaracinus sp.]